MYTYIRFLLGMAVIGVLVGFVIPKLLSSASDFLVTVGFALVLLAVPLLIWMYWHSSWNKLIEKLNKEKEEDHE